MLKQQAGGIFSASDGGSGEATGAGTGIGSRVAGAKETVPRDQTSILGVWNSGEYLGEVGTSGRFVRVVRPAYYLKLQRISGRRCGRDLSIERDAKVLKKINKGCCVTTVALITYVKKSVFDLLREMTRNCIKENITVQRSCSRRGVVVTNGVFSVNKGENGEGDHAERKRSSFNTPLEVMISC